MLRLRAAVCQQIDMRSLFREEKKPLYPCKEAKVGTSTVETSLKAPYHWLRLMRAAGNSGEAKPTGKRIERLEHEKETLYAQVAQSVR